MFSSILCFFLWSNGNIRGGKEVEKFSEKLYPYLRDVDFTMESLPPELFLKICSFLPSHDLFSIGSTSEKLKNSIEEDVSLWKRISKIELFNFAGASTPSTKEINLAVFLATHRNGEFCIYNILNL